MSLQRKFGTAAVGASSSRLSNGGLPERGDAIQLYEESHAKPSPFAALTSSELTRLYDGVSHNKAAVICLARDVRRMRHMEGIGMALGGLSLFQHGNTPCLKATVCGMVVGVVVKERKVIYEVDDGTAVLRVHVSGQAADPERNEERIERSRDGAKAQQQSIGVPSCYIRPASPKRNKHRSATSARTGAHASFSSHVECKAKHEVGEVVRVTGKIKVDFGSDRVLSPATIVTLRDPNGESRHQLQAIRLAEEVYTLPLTSKRLQELSSPSTSNISSGTPWNANARDARTVEPPDLDPPPQTSKHDKNRARVYSPDAQQLKEYRRMISPPSSDLVTPKAASRSDQYRSVQEHRNPQSARRLLSSPSQTAETRLVERTPCKDASSRLSNVEGKRRTTSIPDRDDRCITILDSSDAEAGPSVSHQSISNGVVKRRKEKGGYDSSTSQESRRIRQSSVASFTSSPGSSSRRLRKHQKLSDSQITDSYFRLQVQKHLADNFNGASCSWEMGSGPQFHPPEPFSASDLIAQVSLRELAERLVRIKLRRRAQASTTSTGSLNVSTGSAVVSSSESISEKVKRLFQWTIRQMMADGFILLAASPDVIDLTELPPSSGASIQTGPSSEETYQLVAPETLAEPLLTVLGPRGLRRSSKRQADVPAVELDTDGVAHRLMRSDDRFSSLTIDAIETALYGLLARNLVARTTSGRWRRIGASPD